jgi:hypothetical protein
MFIIQATGDKHTSLLDTNILDEEKKVLYACHQIGIVIMHLACHVLRVFLAILSVHLIGDTIFCMQVTILSQGTLIEGKGSVRLNCSLR